MKPMYSWPSAAKAIGVACPPAGSLSCHCTLPVLMSIARRRLSVAAAMKTSPAAVIRDPPLLGVPILIGSSYGIPNGPLARASPSGASHKVFPVFITTMAAKAPVPRVAADNPSASKDWPTYGGSNHALRYSSLAQINASNVKQLKRVWTFRTGDLPNEKTKDKYSPETTPIKVGDSLFVCSAKNILISLHAATGA